MTSITEFNSKPCPQWDATDVNAYFDLYLEDDDKTKLTLDNSWGTYTVDLTPAVHAAEHIDHLMLDPTDNPVYLRFDNEAGDSECIHGDDLSHIISMRYLKDVAQGESMSEGDFYVMGDDDQFHPSNISSIAEGIAQELKHELLNILYPVGTYYETSNADFDPNVSWGGTWIEDSAGRVTVAQDQYTFSTLGDTGGEERHTLIASELPHLTGTIQGRKTESGGDSINTYPMSATTGVFTFTDNSGDVWSNVASEQNNTSQYQNATVTYDNGGEDVAHNNLQPYVIVKRWHRIA